MEEQGTHKPLVVGSNPTLATEPLYMAVNVNATPIYAAFDTLSGACFMLTQTHRQGTQLNSARDDYLFTWLEAFLIDRKAQGLSAGTLHFYRVKLKKFSQYCEAQAVNHLHQITPLFIREYLLWLDRNICGSQFRI